MAAGEVASEVASEADEAVIAAEEAVVDEV